MPDRELLFINLAVLFGIVTIPFTTSLGAIWYKQGNDAKWAIGIYCANWIYVSCSYMLLIHHLKGHQHLSSQATGVTLQSLWRKGAIGLTAYIIATVVSLFLPVVAFLICPALAIYYVFGVENEETSEIS